jgi:hypothetical protein
MRSQRSGTPHRMSLQTARRLGELAERYGPTGAADRNAQPERPGRAGRGWRPGCSWELLFAGRRTFGALGPSVPDRSLKFADLTEEAAGFTEPFAAAAWAPIDRRQAGGDVDGEATSRTVQIRHRRDLALGVLRRGPQSAVDRSRCVPWLAAAPDETPQSPTPGALKRTRSGQPKPALWGKWILAGC